jgi:hypothetical protein
MVLFQKFVRRFGLLFLAWWPSWLEVGIIGHNFGRGPSKDHSTKVWLQLAQWFLRRRFLCEFPIGTFAYFDRLCKLEKRGDEIKKKSSPLKLLSQSQPNCAEMILGWSSSKLVSGFLCEFPIGSYVKLCSAVGAILIGGPNRRTHFWKRTIQWLFHQNFVPKIVSGDPDCQPRWPPS